MEVVAAVVAVVGVALSAVVLGVDVWGVTVTMVACLGGRALAGASGEREKETLAAGVDLLARVGDTVGRSI